MLLETPLGNLSQILHHINGAYTTYFNTKRKRSGHLFEGRCKAILVEKDSYFQKDWIYVSHQYGGFALKEIGTYYGMKGVSDQPVQSQIQAEDS